MLGNAKTNVNSADMYEAVHARVTCRSPENSDRAGASEDAFIRPNEYSMEFFRLFLQNNSVYSDRFLSCRPWKTESWLVFCRKRSVEARMIRGVQLPRRETGVAELRFASL